MGIDKPQRRLGSPSSARDPSVRRDVDVPTWSSRREHLESSPAGGTAPPQAARGRGPADAPPAPCWPLKPPRTHLLPWVGAACTQAASLSDHPWTVLHNRSLQSSGFDLTAPGKLTVFDVAAMQ